MSFLCAVFASVIIGNTTSAGFGWGLFFSLASIRFALDENNSN
jgi:hypothetical protein